MDQNNENNTGSNNNFNDDVNTNLTNSNSYNPNNGNYNNSNFNNGNSPYPLNPQFWANPVANQPHWPMFWLGLVIAVAINLLSYVEGFDLFDTIYVIFGLIYFIFSIIYAAFLYPSLFKGNPKITSAKAVAFLNGFCGTLIFGLCWQFNLKKNVKGVSNVVFVVLSLVGFVLGILIIIASVVYMLPYI